MISINDTVGIPFGMNFGLRHNAAPWNETYSLHYHDHYEVFYSISGNMIYAVEGRRYQLDAGTLLIIEPYQFHQLISNGNGGAERISVRFRAEILQQLSTEDCDLNICFDSYAHSYNNLIRLDEYQKQYAEIILNALLREQVDNKFGRSLAEKVLMTQFFLLINRAVQQGAHVAPLVDSSSQMVQQAVEYIELNYAEEITLENLGKRFGVDRFRLSRDFSRLVGCPPHRFLLQKRLQKVEQQLRAGVAPQEAAYKCGFIDYTNFYRRFKSVYGVSPKAFQSNIFAISKDS